MTGRTAAVPPGPSRTLKGSAVVAIGVDRHGVARDNSVR